MWLTFPKDITISEDSLQCGNQKVSYDEIKSIRVYIKQTTTNLTAWTGIPTVSDLKSAIYLLLIDGNRIDIEVVNYEEWGPFKNKEGMETFKDGFAFSTFLEEKTFKQRMDHYLKTGTHDMHFKYRAIAVNVNHETYPSLPEDHEFLKDYEFLKDKTIRSGGKIYASFNPEEWTVKRSFKKLSFWQTGIFGTLDTIFGRDERDVTSINLTYDEDVILHLINKLIGVSPKIDKS